ncbi:bile acid:sodium symporter family protein [Nocardioides dubius]|uniref:Bile acid:sodium symporter n=1 Tax=Nocardioides dubius TaxID=317019 RepID=A0ABN1TXS2_9ACTN
MKRLDPFMLAIVTALLVGSAVPLDGQAAVWMDRIVAAGIFWVFFLYGIKIAPKEAGRALANWRLHSLVLASTYVLFPLLGLLTTLIPHAVLPDDLALGVLFLCLLPSTVQSSVTFTSIAQGNVAGAMSAASLSNLAGVFITPLLAAALMGGTLTLSADLVLKVAAQLLLPFVLGQIARPFLADAVKRHPRAITLSDRSAITLAVFAAASHAREAGVWSAVSALDLLVLFAVMIALLAAVLTLTWLVGRETRLPRGDRVVLVMCGSKKSLASGIPMATVLLPASGIGMVVLPLILFHQLQLLTCATIARRWQPPPSM